MNPISGSITRAIEFCGGVMSLAEKINASPQAIYFWRDGKRRLKPEMALAIEHATGERVTRADLMPTTWHVHWPELVNPRPDWVASRLVDVGHVGDRARS